MWLARIILFGMTALAGAIWVAHEKATVQEPGLVCPADSASGSEYSKPREPKKPVEIVTWGELKSMFR